MSDFELNTQEDLLDNLLSDFLDEADQLLTQLNDNLLQLDEWVQTLDDQQQQRCDGELLNEMFRAAHSLKGLSAMLGLSDINSLTHKIENVFDAARKDELGISRDVVDLVFMGLDRLTALVDLLKDPQLEPVDCDPVVNKIRSLLQEKGVERKQSSQAEAERALAELSDNCPPPPATAALNPFEGILDEEEISERYLSIFVDEAEPSLEEISAGLLALHQEDLSEHLRHLLGVVHKLKGSSASIGLNRSAKFAHLIEDILEDANNQTFDLSQEVVDLLLRCTDTFQQYIADLRSGVANAQFLHPLACELVRLHRGATPADSSTGKTGKASLPPQSPMPPMPVVAPVLEQGRLAERLESIVSEIQRRLTAADPPSIAAGAGISANTVIRVRDGGDVKLDSVRTLAQYLDAEHSQVGSQVLHRGCVVFEPDLTMAGLKAQLICEKLAKFGTLVACHPSAAELEDSDSLDSFRFQLLSTQCWEKICRQLRIAGVSQVTVDPETPGPTSPADRPSGLTASGDDLPAGSPRRVTEDQDSQPPAWPPMAGTTAGDDAISRPATHAATPSERVQHSVAAAATATATVPQQVGPVAATSDGERSNVLDRDPTPTRFAAAAQLDAVATVKEPRERSSDASSRPRKPSVSISIAWMPSWTLPGSSSSTERSSRRSATNSPPPSIADNRPRR